LRTDPPTCHVPDESLWEKLVRLARDKPRYGYRGLQVLVEREGERVNPVNHKRLWPVCGGGPRPHKLGGQIATADSAEKPKPYK
jgi:hypothetical protein